MKKTKRCIAILCAMVMILSAISIVSFTANAESKRYYPTLTYATNKNDIKKLASFSTTTSHIWSNEKAVITAILKDSQKKEVKKLVKVLIGKTPSNDKDAPNQYYWIVGQKNSKGVIKYHQKNRKIGKYYIQELFEINRVNTENNKLYISLSNNKSKYYVNGFFRVYGETTFNGNGATMIKTNNNPIFINFDDTNTNTNRYDGSGNITVKNMTVNCTAVSTAKKVARYGLGFMYAAHASGLTVDNITVKNGYLVGHGFQITAMENVLIKNTKFIDCMYKTQKTNEIYSKNTNDKEVDNGQYHDKSYVKDYYSKETIQIEPDYSDTSNGKTFAVPTIKMSNDDTVSRNVTIDNCTFKNVMRAIGNHSARGGRSHHITVKNCKFNNTVGHAIVLSKFKNVTIANNTFRNISSTGIAGVPIYAVSYGSDNSFSVKNNSFYFDDLVDNYKPFKVVNVW